METDEDLRAGYIQDVITLFSNAITKEGIKKATEKLESIEAKVQAVKIESDKFAAAGREALAKKLAKEAIEAEIRGEMDMLDEWERLVNEAKGYKESVDAKTGKITRIDYGDHAVAVSTDPKTGETIYTPIAKPAPVKDTTEDDQLASGNYDGGDLRSPKGRPTSGGKGGTGGGIKGPSTPGKLL
jgi:hypothetical protein